MEFDARLQATHGLPATFGMDAAFAEGVPMDSRRPSSLSPLISADLQSLDPQLSYYGPDSESSHAEFPLSHDRSADEQFGSAHNQAASSAEAQKRPRACEGCRGLKVRCDFPPEAENCKRCAKARRQCIVTVPSRKRQRKTDSKVADLERRIDDLTATVEEQKKLMAVEQVDSRLSPKRHAYPEMSSLREEPANKRRRPSFSDSEDTEVAGGFSRDENQRQFLTIPAPPPSAQEVILHNEYADVIDRGFVTSEQASRVYDHYRANMERHLPCVVFDLDATCGSVRKTRPVLFLAILSVASGQEYPEIQRVMAREAMKTIADRVLCRGEKSLELVQAMQVLTIWHAPEDPRDTMTFQLIQMAVSMAISLDLNIAHTQPSFALPGSEPRPQSSNGVEVIEKRRAWLSCFLLSGVCSQPMRQQNTVKWSPFLDNIVKLLQSQPETSLDHTLCRWVEIQRISDRSSEIGASLAGGGLNKNAARTELRSLLSRLKGLAKEVDQHKHISLNLEILEAEVHSRMVAIKAEEEADKGPTASFSKSRPQPSKPSVSHSAAIRDCQTSIHCALDAFSSFLSRASPIELNALPSLHFARIAYCLVALICLHFSSSAASSKLKDTVPATDLRVADHLQKLLGPLQGAVSEDAKRPAQMFQLLVKMLKAWFERKGGRNNGRGAGTSGGPTSMASLSPSDPLNSGGPRQPSATQRGQAASRSPSAIPDPTAVSSLQVQPPASDERSTPRMGYRKLFVGLTFDGDAEEPWAPTPPGGMTQGDTPKGTPSKPITPATSTASDPQRHLPPQTHPSPRSGSAIHRSSTASIDLVAQDAAALSARDPALPLHPPHPSPSDISRAASWPQTAEHAGWYDPSAAYLVRLQHQQQQQQPSFYGAASEGAWAPGLALDPAIEQAMGLAFGPDGQMLGSFVDDSLGGGQGGEGEFGWFG